MKKIVVLVLALVPLCVFAQQGQARKTVDERVENQTERMAKDLNLSEEQKAQVATINKKYAEQAKERRTEAKTEKQANREAMKQIADAREAELKSVLTQEQYTKHQELKAAKQKQRQAKMEKHKQKNRKGAAQNKF